MFDLINWIKKNFQKTNTIEANCDVSNDIETSTIRPSTPFEKKVIYLVKKVQRQFPESYTTRDGITTVFEKEKYFCVANKVYDDAAIDEFIKSIEIVDSVNGDGECFIDDTSENLQLIIRISCNKLGIIAHSGYIQECTSKSIEIFQETFAHELVHAKDLVDIANIYGAQEIKKIRSNPITNHAHHILCEYSACRKTAEKYGLHDSSENIENYINHIKIVLSQYNDQAVQSTLKCLVYKLNYAIATRCAFIQVDSEEDEQFDKCLLSLENGYKEYIVKIKDLLQQNYILSPLNYDRYYQFGNNVMDSLASIIGLDENYMNDFIASVL